MVWAARPTSKNSNELKDPLQGTGVVCLEEDLRSGSNNSFEGYARNTVGDEGFCVCNLLADSGKIRSQDGREAKVFVDGHVDSPHESGWSGSYYPSQSFGIE